MTTENKQNLGQVFTSQTIADYMSSLFTINKDSAVLDPCFGGGVFLESLQKHSYTNVVGYEIDSDWYSHVKARFTNFTIKRGDFLRLDQSVKYKGIIMNPPYIRQEKINDLAPFGITKTTLKENDLFSELPKNANLYMYFVVKAIELLEDEGELIAIFPDSWMTAKGGKKFKKTIDDNADITEQIDVFGEAFDGKAMVEVSILKMVKRNYHTDTHYKKILVHNRQIEAFSESDSLNENVMPVSFGVYATVRRGLTTGCNSIFINPAIEKREDMYFYPIISSPKSFTGFNTNDAKTDRLLYISDPLSIDDEVNKYLSKCEEEIQITHEPKTIYEKIKNNKPWFELNLFPCKGIIFSYFVRNEMKFCMNSGNAMVRDNFYIIYPKEGVSDYLLFAMLNNYFTFYQLESSGKKYGAGLLKVQRYDIEELRFPDLNSLNNEQKKMLSDLGRELSITGDNDKILQITRAIAEIMDYPYYRIKKSYEEKRKSRLEQG